MVIIDSRFFLVINTTDYNNDKKASYDCVQGIDGCTSMGWDIYEEYLNYKNGSYTTIDEMIVGDIISSADYNGAYLMRIA
jgi:hypothetical protein